MIHEAATAASQQCTLRIDLHDLAMPLPQRPWSRHEADDSPVEHDDRLIRSFRVDHSM